MKRKSPGITNYWLRSREGTDHLNQQLQGLIIPEYKQASIFLRVTSIDGFEHLVPKREHQDYHFSVEDQQDEDEISSFTNQMLGIQLTQRKTKKKTKKVMAKQNSLPQNKCTFAIDRLNRVQNLNFAKVSTTFPNGTAKMYTDPDFTPDATSIIWTDYASPKIMGELSRY